MAPRNVQINEKEISATTASSDEPLEANEAAVVIPERNLTRAIWTIVYGVALPCIPIIIICAILLYIIFKHRLHLDPGLPVLRIPSNDGEHNGATYNATTFASAAGTIYKQGGKWAYHVQYNPSTITTIASWTSRIIPYLQSSIMALVAFFAARHIVLKSKHGDESQLPNPEQLALLIGTLGGSGFTPLKDVLLYRFGKNGRLVNPLPAAVTALAAITIMALIIPIIDTWFGVATSVETVIQLNATTGEAYQHYGKSFSYESCPNGPADNGTENRLLVNKTAFWPCNVQVDETNPYVRHIINAGEGINIAIGASSQSKVLNYTDLTGNNVWYLGSPTQSTLQDYQAKTFATTSQCQAMTQKQCLHNLYSENSTYLRFQCNDNFAGSLDQKRINASATGKVDAGLYNIENVGLAFAGNAALTDVTGLILTNAAPDDSSSLPPAPSSLNGTLDPEIYRTNPLYYGVWAFGFPGSDVKADGSDEYNDFDGDGSYYYVAELGGFWLLNCSSTIYEMEYTWVNGTVAASNLSLAPTEVAALFAGPFAVGASAAIDNSLNRVAAIAGSTNNSIGIANTFAAEYSKLLLAYSIGALEPEVVSAQQNRTAIHNVARVPLIPLYLLLATKAIYVLAVIILAIAAYAFTHPAETEIVKDQLTVKGLTSAHFDRPDVMQEYAVQQLQNFEASKSSSPPDIDGSSKPLLQHAATAPPDIPAAKNNKPNEPKIGLIPAVDGTWQWVVKADGVWNSVKPIVKTIVKDIVLQEAQAGNLGTTGNVINAYTGKPLK